MCNYENSGIFLNIKSSILKINMNISFNRLYQQVLLEFHNWTLSLLRAIKRVAASQSRRHAKEFTQNSLHLNLPKSTIPLGLHPFCLDTNYFQISPRTQCLMLMVHIHCVVFKTWSSLNARLPTFPGVLRKKTGFICTSSRTLGLWWSRSRALIQSLVDTALVISLKLDNNRVWEVNCRGKADLSTHLLFQFNIK